MVMVLIRWWMCALCLVSIGVNAGQLSTRYSYDEAGNKNSQTDALGHITHWTYSLTNQITSRILPDGSTESFSYDSQGNRTSYTDFNGQITRYAYDLNDRLTLTQYPDGRSIKKTYTLSGQTETLTESQTIAGKTTAKVTRYSYDIMDRLLKVEYPNKQVITYSYDAAGRLLSRSTVNGTSRYTYDVMDNLITVTDTLGQVTTYEYDAVGNKTRRTLPNGQYSTYGYNFRHQLTEINHFRADQSLIGRYQYTLNETGLRTAVTETQADINQASQNHTRTLTYNYDSLNRLSQETAIDTDNAFGGSYSRTYHYDSVGNRSQQVHSYTDTQGQAATITTDYSYDANDQLLAETIHSPTLTDTISYQYDKNGNLTQKTNQNGVLARYRYTTDNKLSLIEQGNLSIRYAYDSQGNRIQSITTDNSQTTPKTETVAYLVDNNFSYPEVIEEQDAQGKLITSNTFIPKGVGDLLSINRANQGTYYASEDALGSLRQLTNTQGKVEAQQQTTAWGEVLPVSNVSQYTAYGYTGERQDSQTGLVYLRAREYAPSVGRFVQRDTHVGNMRNPVTLNKQVYANANPVNYTDPTGRFGLSEVSVANSIASVLQDIQITTGTSILDAALDPDAGNTFLTAGVGAIIGAVGIKVVPFISTKIKSLIAKNKCFMRGTLVYTSKGLMAIEKIKIGDYILSLNTTNNKYEYQKVNNIFITKDQPVGKILLKNKYGKKFNLYVTMGHPFLMGNKWIQSQDLRVGNKLTSKNGFVEVYKKWKFYKNSTVYNISVKKNHNYLVGKLGVVAHNSVSCIDIARIISKGLPASLKCKYECKDFAEELKKGLIKSGITGTHITIYPPKGMFVYSDKNKIIASQDMEHQAIKVGDTVFDNLFPNGVSYSEWINDLGGDLLTTAGYKIVATAF